MAPNTHIRKAKKADSEILAKILNLYLGNATLHLEPYSASILAKKISSATPRTGIWVLELNDQVIAYAEIKKFSPKLGYQYAAETSLFLDEPFINKGYGTLLKKFIIEMCKSLGYHSIIAKIFKSNTASIHYNKKLGYRVVGVLKEAGRVEEKWIDICIMQLSL